MANIVKYGEIVNTGSSAIKVMRNSLPVFSMNTSRANAIPIRISWEELSGWQHKRWRAIHYQRKNHLGGVIVNLYIDILWQCRGYYKGLGGYILNAYADVRIDRLFCGQKIDIDVEFGTPYNDGSINDPLATLPFYILIKHKSLFSIYYSKYNGYLQGDGYGTYGYDTGSEANYPNYTKPYLLND